jgi:hypothetical protein
LPRPPAPYPLASGREPLVLLAANELPAPDDGPQNPFYSLALFLAGFLLLADQPSARSTGTGGRY